MSSLIRRIYTHPAFHSTLFGTTIAGINLYNIRLKRNQEDDISKMRYVGVSLGKGVLYGLTYPFSVVFVFMGAVDSNHEFRKHFVPLSVNGSPEDRQEIEENSQDGCPFDIQALSSNKKP